MADLKTRKFAAKFLKIGSEVADLVVQMRSATPLNLTAIGLRALQTHLVTSLNKEQVLQGWTNLELTRFGETLRLLFGPVLSTHKFNNHSGAASFDEFVVHGSRIALDMGSTPPSVWTTPRHEESTARAALGRLVWESFGSNISASTDKYFHISPWLLERDPLAYRGLLPSRTADDLVAWCNRFISAGKPRSVLVRGKPGTGKSSLMRNVASQVGGLCVRLSGSSIADAGLDGTAALLNFLRPSVVLVDDLDRTSTSSILSCLEVVRDYTKLTLASANYVRLIDPAARRPGRFDRILELEHLDRETIDKLIGDDVPEEIAAKLRALPVAYIDEFHVQRDVLGLSAALESVLALEECARDIEIDGAAATTRDASPSLPKS